MAQAPDGSGPLNPEMPRSAIASGLIDVAVPAKHMGGKLLAFARGFDTLQRIEELAPAADDMSLDQASEAILTVLRGHSGPSSTGMAGESRLLR